ncbi:MAG: alcohol dehydrogenase catalytic domain-containing protein, partial [Geminicoccaceae bacterium]
MRAILCTEPKNDLSTTGLADVPVPDPVPGAVRVKVNAVSLNPVDWKLCAGVAPWWQEPHIVGLDAAGVIDALGDGVEGWAVGDPVVWHGNLNAQGVFAEFATTPAHVLSRIPAGVDAASAAAIPCAGYTAFQGLVRKAHV